ncbi:MAG TPA: hypothetical protein VJY33_23795 [Isosphaeraceae bacterium]|nr:hypothetical protein [Isosphaeraceae bacterium]
MLASTRPNPGKRGRRGIVLVLVLGMLALMALIGITFATFSGQSRVSARNFFQSMNQPQRDELMDYALSQLISDTPNRQSAIRGHSMARDMYGNDASLNGYLASRPDGEYRAPNNDPYFYITGISQVGTTTQYNLTTNILANDPVFYGYTFTRWNIRVSYQAVGVAGIVDQTLEVLADSGFNASLTTGRVLTVNIGLTEGNSVAATVGPPPTPAIPATILTNPTLGTTTTLPGQSLIAATGMPRFILDGRWLHAFNGPGMGAKAQNANFRYNGSNPNSAGMDEDYDAVDLENWFLAMQSADGSVIIPSFHRPAAIRYDPNGLSGAAINDWTTPPASTAPTWSDSASRILRPRQADGHDATTFPDLIPDSSSGKINYDVDNDGDGLTDSVWLDLGYPARRNAQGQLYKPLFAFMVIGLNGRIPLNTAGNLAGSSQGIPYISGTLTYNYGGSPMIGTSLGYGGNHAAHLGNSVSEVDPTYALQSAFDSTYDAAGAFSPPGGGAYNTQVDNAGVDVRVTQLRNLLAGTRPLQNTTIGLGTNGDSNYVFAEPAAGSGTSNQLYMPNGVADPYDTPVFATDASGAPVIQRATPPVAGRWGEAGSIPGGISAPGFATPPGINNSLGATYLNLVRDTYVSSVRAGYSYDATDILTTSESLRDAADDNLNAFDPYPPGHTGELNDQDYYDVAGALTLPVDRMRRYVTPADINGTGSVTPWNTTSTAAGSDPFGRVLFKSYYRPPGSPGSIATSPDATTPPPGVGTLGAIYYPTTSNGYFYSNGPNNNSPPLTTALAYATFLPDVTNNPLHAFEFFRLPPVTSGVSGHGITAGAKFQFQRNGGMLLDLAANQDAHGFPIKFPTYDYSANATGHSDGLNEADEMNLYVPNLQIDAPFGPSDLEWLYRQQDVDGASLTSRLAQLAPVSFTNPIDGLRRRRLFAIDSWEMNNFVWANDNPRNVFPNNRSFTATQNASFSQLSTNLATTIPTAPLAHRDKKINLNYPLPVSNDPNEPIRQKWISDAYQLMKAVLPPRSVDTPEELAELSQFLVNVIDFRDPDCTMTHFRNPDVKVVLGSISGGAYTPTYLAMIGQTIPVNPPGSPTNPSIPAIPLDQFGMEYNPVAINEAIAYSFQRAPGTPTNRFYVELVNTLSQTALGLLPSTDFGGTTIPPDVSTLDLSINNYDLVMTADDPVSRPDPFTGQLLPIASANYYAQIPFNQQLAGSPYPLFTTGGDLQLTPLWSLGAPAGTVPAASDFNTSANYFYSIANPNPGGEPNAALGTVTLSGTYDPLMPPSPALTAVPANVVPPGFCGNLAPIVVPPATTPPLPLGKQVTVPPYVPPPIPQIGSGAMLNYWICLRRPANPFAPPQGDPTLAGYNPMVVVDAMRFPYHEGSSAAQNMIYSSQRCQPFRGGHAVRLPGDTGSGAAPLYTPYGYSEQMTVPQTQRTGSEPDVGNNGTGPVTKPIWHTIGLQNDLPEPWDYFPFNDRDFTSVAELMLVPGCPPGLFTKQFVELPPMPPVSSGTPGSPLTQFPVPIPPPNYPTAPTPTSSNPPVAWPNGAVAFPAGAKGTSPAGVAQPHTYPYLVDKFFYTGYGAAASTTTPPSTPLPDLGNLVDGYGGDGWFKMFEFFEVPSQSLGAIGSVAQGTDFDWARQDTKPGLLNLNLIVDEEVFFSILGSQSLSMMNGSLGTDSFTQSLLDFAQLPAGSADIPQVVTASNANGAPVTSVPIWSATGSRPGLVATDGITVAGASNGMKAAFAQFLNLRHGGTGMLFTANPTVPERPFHALSYPDINYTVMRPANLPPVTPSLPTSAATPYPPTATPFYTQDPGVRNPYINPSSQPSGILNATGVYVANMPTVVVPPATSPYGAYFTGMNSYVSLPPPIPVRRLFQIPDAYTNGAATTLPPVQPPVPTPTATTSVSNAGDYGDPFVNVIPLSGTPNLAPGALGTVTNTITPGTNYVNNGYPNLVWSGNTPTVTPPTINYLGSNNSANVDNTQHPYWRSEMMQKVMNLTTVRTHQYAVWITIGFFEVKREGDLGMIAQGVPLLAYDLLGPEIGAASGQTTRYRGFFLVDRTKLYGFDDTTPGSFTPAVVYRQMIE